MAAVVGIISGVAVLATAPAEASVYNGTVEITCTEAVASGTGSHVLDRDNTGSGQEAFHLEIHDGTGTLIYELEFSNVLGEFAGGIGTFFYTTPPNANPISFRLTSVAGNGLPAQVDVLQIGSCAELPAPPITRPGGLEPVDPTPTTEAPTTTAAPTTSEPPVTVPPPSTVVPPTTTPRPTTTMAPTTTTVRPGQVTPATAARPVNAPPTYTG